MPHMSSIITLRGLCRWQILPSALLFLMCWWILFAPPPDLVLPSAPTDTAWLEQHQVRCLNDTLRGGLELSLVDVPRFVELFRDMAAGLDAAGIVWYPSYGTLLGLYRNCRFLPWEHDIDFQVPAEQFNLFGTMFLNPLMLYRFSRAVDGAILRNGNPSHYHYFMKYVSPFGNGGFKVMWGIPIQIYWGEVEVGFVHTLSTGEKFLATDPEYGWERLTGIDMRLCPFHWEGMWFRVPCNTAEVVTRAHGESWRTPIKLGVNNRLSNYMEAPVSEVIPGIYRFYVSVFIVCFAAVIVFVVVKWICASPLRFHSLTMERAFGKITNMIGLKPQFCTSAVPVVTVWVSAAVCFQAGWPYWLSCGQNYVCIFWPKTGVLFLDAILFFGGLLGLEPQSPFSLDGRKDGNTQPSSRVGLRSLPLVVVLVTVVFVDLHSLEHWRTRMFVTSGNLCCTWRWCWDQYGG
eukprot:TRINITY_DN12944_c0_g1_i1.p1 TRINITY_DN12944_c0_g1~~TRINITY_DN12944_c0_g1_i1.p1  ORF type:complete len:469 (-),score=3.96 TRINITY_DN12944_c0_g1_i1:283-1662(-)